jgi:hypothetical protein
MDTVTIGIVAYLLGMVASILYPYLTVYLETGEKFNFKYAISRVIGAVILGLTAVVTPGFIEWLEQSASAYDYTLVYALAIFLTTFGAGAIARETQKIGSTFKKISTE